MGVRATLTEVPPDAFDEIMKGGNPDLSGSRSYSLDKAWSELQEVLRSEEYPLNLAIVGDALHPDSRHSYDEFNRGNHDYYAGFVTVETVNKIAKMIEFFTLGDMTELDSETSLWSDRDKDLYRTYVESRFNSLQAAYREASRHGNALMVVIA